MKRKKTFNQYRLTLSHDKGRIKLLTVAETEEAAVRMIMKVEGCPACAIIKIKKVKKVYSYTIDN